MDEKLNKPPARPATEMRAGSTRSMGTSLMKSRSSIRSTSSPSAGGVQTAANEPLLNVGGPMVPERTDNAGVTFSTGRPFASLSTTRSSSSATTTSARRTGGIPT